MTLGEAKLVIRAGLSFGEVFPMVDDHEQDALREWYVREPGVPVNAVANAARTAQDRRSASRPVSGANGSLNGSAGLPGAKKASGTATGDVCRECGGLSLVRTGSCVTCQDCGANEGCG